MGDVRTSKRCEWLDWHRPGTPVKWSLASANGAVTTCQRCGRSLLLDSQGNWFGVGQASYQVSRP